MLNLHCWLCIDSSKTTKSHQLVIVTVIIRSKTKKTICQETKQKIIWAIQFPSQLWDSSIPYDNAVKEFWYLKILKRLSYYDQLRNRSSIRCLYYNCPINDWWRSRANFIWNLTEWYYNMNHILWKFQMKIPWNVYEIKFCWSLTLINENQVLMFLN